MAIARWADYSGGRPSGAALKNKGFVGVIRYVGGGSNAKRLTRGEYANLVANGLQVKLVFEIGIHDAEAGYSVGVANAKAARADATALGVPAGVVIYAASDEHMTAAQVQAGVQYVKGFRDVLGVECTGAYGFAEFVDAVHSAGFAHEYWKSGSAPTAGEKFVTFWQRNQAPVNATVDGVVVDINDQELALTATEDDMAFTDAISDSGPGHWDHLFQNIDQIIQDLRNGNLANAVAAAVINADISTANPGTTLGHVTLNADQIVQDVRSGALASAVAAKVPAATVDVSALETAVTAAVQAAVKEGLQGLSLAVSDSAVQAIATASATASLGALKAALPEGPSA